MNFVLVDHFKTVIIIITFEKLELPPAIATNLQKFGGPNNLNINLPDSNAVLRLEVELRDKNTRRRPNYRNKGLSGERNRAAASPTTGAVRQSSPSNSNSYFIPMEKVSDILMTFDTFYGNSIIYSPLILVSGRLITFREAVMCSKALN